MRKISILLLLIISLVLSACSDSNGEDEQVDVDKPSVLGIVHAVEDNTFTMESRDRIKEGQIVVTKRMEIEENAVEVQVGDTVSVYHDTIEGGQPARINRVYAIDIIEEATPESIARIQEGSDNEDENEVGYDDVNYYLMPILTVINNDGDVTELTEQESAITHDIINSAQWEEGAIENFQHEYQIVDGENTVITFDPESHVLNDGINDISSVLYEGVSTMLKDTLNRTLEK